MYLYIILLITRGKVYLKLNFTLELMELNKGQKPAEMKGRKKTTGHLKKYAADVR